MLVYPNFKNLTDTELEQENDRFNLEISNAELTDQAWAELSVFFEQNPDLKEKYKYSYWRWYIILSWQKVFSLPGVMLLQLISEQIPVALIAGIDVLDITMRYLARNYFAREDIGSYFFKLKTSFQESTTVVGVWKSSEVTVAELSKKIVEIGTRNDSLEQAEFESKLRQIMFLNDPTVIKFATENQDEAVQRFIDLAVFFNTTDETTIWYVVDAFLAPEKYQTSNEAPAIQTTEQLIAPEAATTTVTPAQSTEPVLPTKPTPTEIKSQIESQFKKDAEGNFEDIEGVMAMLSQMAEKYNDLAIADMLYFDETEYKFKWNL